MPEIKFEKQFGKGTDPWYAKAERWAKKQKNPFTRHLLLGMIQWLKEKWIDVKVANTMRDIDIQAEEIKKIWDEEEKNQLLGSLEDSISEIQIESDKIHNKIESASLEN